MAMPISPPATPRITLSVSACRIRAERAAPRAVRMEVSARQQKVGYIGARHEQYQSGNSGEEPQAITGPLLKVLHTTTRGHDDDVLFGNARVASADCVAPLGCQPLTQGVGDPGLQSTGRNSRFHPPEKIQPIRVGMFQKRRLTFNNRF